ECVLLPGGFSYGDYLRTGAIARFSPIMKSVAKFAADGGLVIGICNGFQILCEAHLLPGALTHNRSLSFICERVWLRVENASTPFTRAAKQGDLLRLPIKHGEGLYVAPEDELRQMEERGQVILRYVDADGRESDAANPVGQRLSVERAWQNAGLSPAECSLIEGHGTSTRVGDVAEVTSLMEAFSGAYLAPGSVALGSVKSNIGHLKAAAGAAGMLKATLALHEKVLPASINFDRPNPNLDWTASPFAVNTELRDWEVAADRTRVAGVSAFGFGGTNFHVVLQEHVPGLAPSNGHRSMAVPAAIGASAAAVSAPASGSASEGEGRSSEGTSGASTVARGEEPKAPLRGALVLGAADRATLIARLRAVADAAGRGEAPPSRPPQQADLRAAERVAIDYGDAAELGQRSELALRALDGDSPAAWSALAGRGIFRGSGAPGQVAVMYTGQGSQYANMLSGRARREPIVAEAFETADRVMAPLLDGRALSELIFVDPDDA